MMSYEFRFREFLLLEVMHKHKYAPSWDVADAFDLYVIALCFVLIA